jgi:hypothetical protein
MNMNMMNMTPRFSGLTIAEICPLSGPMGGESLKLVVHATNDKAGNDLDQFQTLFGLTKETAPGGKTTEAQSFTISGQPFPGGRDLLYKGKKVLIDADPKDVQTLVKKLLKKLPGLDKTFKQQLESALAGFYRNFEFNKRYFAGQK